jgi:hypothetical protein
MIEISRKIINYTNALITFKGVKLMPFHSIGSAFPIFEIHSLEDAENIFGKNGFEFLYLDGTC